MSGRTCWRCGALSGVHPLCGTCHYRFTQRQMGYLKKDTPIWPVYRAITTHRWYAGTRTPLTSNVEIITDSNINLVTNDGLFLNNFVKFLQANTTGSRFAMYKFPEDIALKNRDVIVGFIFDTKRIIFTILDTTGVP